MKPTIYNIRCTAFATLFLMTASANAQKINFETADYFNVSAYDSWEASPLRQGKMTGNCKVVDNPFTDETDPETGENLNGSKKVLGFERAIIASNQYGARIDLNEEDRFELNTNYKYVHVLVHKPNTNRMMCIGLGKRRNRPGQSEEVEQFYVESRTTAVANQWFDAVFAVKGNGGIDIYSLVFIPDLTSPHDLGDDFLAYFDSIEVNYSASSRMVFGDYPVSFDKNASQSRTDRYTTSVSLSGSTFGNKEMTFEARPYVDLTSSTEVFDAQPGDVLTPKIGYKGGWMSGYVYVDYENDGKFSFDINADGTPAAGSNIVTYSFYNGKNSKGESVANGNVITQPSFSLPEDMKEGVYRIRFKVDWADIDPAGNSSDGNQLISNGGCVVDALLRVHGKQVTLNAQQLNGDVQSVDGINLEDTKAEFGQPFTIKMAPAPGFAYDGVKVRYGYNLQGDSIVHGNRQWYEKTFLDNLFNYKTDTFQLPVEVMSGNVSIEGLYVDEKYKKKHVNVTYILHNSNGEPVSEKDFALTEGDAFPAPDYSDLFTCAPAYYSITGQPTGIVGKTDTVIVMTYTDNLPFQVCTSETPDHLYKLLCSPDRYPLYYSTSKVKLKVNKVQPDAEWYFRGDALGGVTIYNTKSGDSYILSAPTTMSGKAGSTTYPRMIKSPGKDGYNTYWALSEGSTISGEQGFMLSQKGLPTNLMSFRDPYLAFWTDTADDNCTFFVEAIATDIQPVISHQSSADTTIYNLAGQKVQTPRSGHIYIVNGQKMLK